MNTEDKKLQTTQDHFSLLTPHFLLKKKGQVAVVLILAAAAALIFYAISLNFGRISQTKTITTIAADTAAATMGSYMASFGQSIFKTTLGGSKKICGWTGLVAVMLAVVVAIIAIAVTIYAPPAGASIWLAAASLVLALGALAMQIMVIQPSLTDAWNSIIWHTMSTTDAFVEQGVQTGLSRAVTDTAQVPDLNDSDGDRLWGFDSDDMPVDKISRFGFYYMEKRINTIPLPASAMVQDFSNKLRNFLTDDDDNWGIIDDTGPVCDSAAGSECNPCCIFPDYWTEEMGCAADDDPDPNIYTPNPADVASMRTTCENNSPYGAIYPWVYDAYRGNPTNAFVSFQEQIGRDDEHQLFEKLPASPNGLQISTGSPPPPLPPVNFKLKDTTGFYTPTVYPPNDNRTGAFPFFYKIADWKVNLDTTTEPFDLANKPHQCHWCDSREPSVGACPGDQPLEILQLTLPAGNPPSGANYNTTFCVDGTNLISGNPPLAVDRVRLPDAATGFIEAASDQCAQRAVGNLNIGFWKRGGDRFCSAVGGDTWPYYGKCPKHDYDGGAPCSADGSGCACGESGNAVNAAGNWPDDLWDDLVYGLNDFADWANELLSKDAALLGRDFTIWYPEASQWIEPGQNNVPIPNNSTTCDSTSSLTSCCYVCADEDGELYKWYKAIVEMRGRLQVWRDTSFAGPQCREVWCVPPDETTDTCLGIFPTPPPAGEEATFDSNVNGIRGDMDDIAACVNWNANDTVTYSDATSATGNAEKFQACVSQCAAPGPLAIEKCSNLPRSLVPGVNTALPSPDPAVVCAPGGWIQGIQQSIPEAQNQVAKFRQRYNYLSGRLNELNTIITILDEAEQKFNDFLTCADTDGNGAPDGAACRLIKARIGFDNQKTGLPYHAIYGWQGEPEKGQPLGSGKWHIVRADARIPERCDRACNVNQAPTGDPGWPYVRTYTENYDTQRCYEFTSTDGIVKARVTRFDESGTFSTLLFPNAVEIWKPTFDRGDRPQTESSNPDDIEDYCILEMAPDPAGGAFMLNERLDSALDPACVADCAGDETCINACPLVSNIPCWDLANRLLSRGVTSEACVQYYFHDGDPNGMDFMFVPCKNF